MRKLLIAAGIAVLAGAVVFLYIRDKNAKIAWVDINKVYGEFEYKKELDAKYMKAESLRKNITDSLELDLKLLYSQLEADPENKAKNILFDSKRNFFLKKKQELDEDSQSMRAQYYEQIANQINQYIKDYGTENKYKIILGADGSGAVMYAEEGSNITKEVIAYINNKYKGL